MRARAYVCFACVRVRAVCAQTQEGKLSELSSQVQEVGGQMSAAEQEKTALNQQLQNGEREKAEVEAAKAELASKLEQLQQEKQVLDSELVGEREQKSALQSDQQQ